MKAVSLIFSLALPGVALVAQEGSVRALSSQDLKAASGKELTILTVE